MSALRYLEFGSKSCPFCSAQKKAKVLERLAAAHPDVEFQRVDADLRDDLADRHNIKGLPSYVILAGDRQVGRLEGAAPFKSLEELLEKAKAKAGRLKAS